MNDNEKTVGQYIVDTLAANGIDTVFGIPGVHNLELYRPLARSSLRHVLVRHEQAAGFAADGFARLSGRIAAAFVISGPGATNILTAAAQAYSDSIPLLIIASSPIRASLHRGWGALHEMRDQCGAAKSALRFARAAASAADVRDHLCAAFAELRAPRPRPAYIEVPLDLLAEKTTLATERFALTQRALQAPAIERAVSLLQEASRAILIAGGGARHAGPELMQVADKLDAFIVTTGAGKNLVPRDRAGSLGASLAFESTRRRIAAADVVLAVGTELAETDTYVPKLDVRGRLIRIDVDELRLADPYRPEVSLLGDARMTLAAIGAALAERQGWRSAEGTPKPYHETLEQESDTRVLPCLRALDAIRAGLPADAAIFTDMTQIAYAGHYFFDLARGQSWHHPFGFGTLGYALPAAVGAKIAVPSATVAALAGDFGFQFTLAELGTAVQARLSLPILLWNNSALGQIRDDMDNAGIERVGVSAHNPDFVALAQAFGAAALRVTTAHELEHAVRSAATAAGPTLIEIIAAGFDTA